MLFCEDLTWSNLWKNNQKPKIVN